MFQRKQILAVAAALMLQSTAFAGAGTATSTTVGTNYGFGSLKDARNNSGSTEQLGCYFGAYVTNYTSSVTSNYIQCTAVAANGASYYCYTYNPSPSWIAMIGALNESSWIYFYGDSSRHCLGINTEQASNHL